MKIREILLEYNKDYLKINFEKKYEQKRNKDHSLPDNIPFDEFLKKIEIPLKQQNKFQFIDPYMKWVVQKYVTDGIRYFEDIPSKAIPALLTYNALKRKNKLKPEHKDISQIKTLNDLMDVVDQYSQEETKSGKEQEKETERKFYESGEAELIYNDLEIKVVVPKSERAACFFGKNTKWCTAATQGENLFSYYNKKGKIYIILIKKENKRFQFHFETEQFMNEKDEPINPRIIASKYPVLWKIFEPISKKLKSPVFVKNPTPEMILNAYKKTKNTDLIEFFIDEIKNFSDDFVLKLVELNPKILAYDIASKKVKEEAIKKDPINICYIYDPSKDLQMLAVNISPFAIKFITDPYEDVQLTAVRKNPMVIDYIVNPNENVQLEAIKLDPSVIFGIKTPTEDVMIEALKRNHQEFGKYILRDKNPSEKVQIFAVSMDGTLIQYIDDPSEKVQQVAIENTWKSIKYISNPSKKIQMKAVQKEPYAISFIYNPSPEAQLEAIKRNTKLISQISNPSPEVLEIVKNKKETT